MRFILVPIVAICSSTAIADPARARPTAYVGQVVIVGNTITQDHVIRAAAATLQPGQILRQRDVRRTQSNLTKLGLFKVDPKTGKGPTVQVLDNPGQFKDILIKVEEGPTTTFRPTIRVGVKTGLLLGFVIEERNFDPWGAPAAFDGFNDGRAFRGGGEKWRLEFGIVVLDPARLPSSAMVRLTSCTKGIELLSSKNGSSGTVITFPLVR